MTDVAREVGVRNSWRFCSICGECWGDDPHCDCRCTRATGAGEPLAEEADGG